MIFQRVFHGTCTTNRPMIDQSIRGKYIIIVTQFIWVLTDNHTIILSTHYDDDIERRIACRGTLHTNCLLLTGRKNKSSNCFVFRMRRLFLIKIRYHPTSIRPAHRHRVQFMAIVACAPFPIFSVMNMQHLQKRWITTHTSLPLPMNSSPERNLCCLKLQQMGDVIKSLNYLFSISATVGVAISWSGILFRFAVAALCAW